MVFNLFTLLITILFIANGIGQLYYAINLKKRFPENHNLLNSIIVFLLWLSAGLVYPFFYFRNTEHVRWFQALSMQIICIYAPLLIFAILFYQFILIKRNKDIREQRKIEIFKERMEKLYIEKSKSKNYPLITDIHRKSFHLIPVIVIIFLWFFAVKIWDEVWDADLFWGISGEEYWVFLILTVGYTGILIFAALDYVRLSYIFKKNIYHLMPKSVSNLLVKTLKPNEIYEFTKPVALVLSFIPIFFLPISIFSAAALVSTLGDGAASIFGIRFGRINFPKWSKKTVIGYIAGFLSSFISSFIVFWIFEPFMPLVEICILSIVGATTYLGIDLLSPKIDDNILNPILSGLVKYFFYLIL
ncbi:MAG: diacylglycerol/polyprenol kinase family protein [Candidatus Hodarchaeota archaeon]